MKKDDLLKKWLVNKLTEEEQEDFKKSENYDLNLKIVEKASHFDVPEDHIVKSYDDFKRDRNNQPNKVIKLRPHKIFYRIAGLFLLVIGIYFFFFNNNLTSVKTLASQKTTFELPDASVVTLNALSEIEYNKKNWENERELSLNGEAFFKVAKGSTFQVITTSGIVSVVGTEFNVKNRNGFFEVECFEGLVNVNSKGTIRSLSKGKTFRIIDGTLTTDSIANDQPNWINNISSFKAIPLSKVLEEFERQYNVEIESANVNTKRIFTGSFANNNLEQALISVTVPFNLTYKKTNSNKITLYKSE